MTLDQAIDAITEAGGLVLMPAGRADELDYYVMERELLKAECGGVCHFERVLYDSDDCFAAVNASAFIVKRHEPRVEQQAMTL
jgi:hypothetical protein